MVFEMRTDFVGNNNFEHFWEKESSRLVPNIRNYGYTIFITFSFEIRITIIPDIGVSSIVIKQSIARPCGLLQLQAFSGKNQLLRCVSIHQSALIVALWINKPTTSNIFGTKESSR